MDKLTKANEYANAHMHRSQQQWVTRHNLRTRPKSFQAGDLLLILTPDSTSKRLWPRWRASATVIGFAVQLRGWIDGTKHHMPVSKLKPYNALLLVEPFDVYCVPAVNVNACTSVFYDCDKHFWNAEQVETGVTQSRLMYYLPIQKICPKKLSHLTGLHRQQLLKVLDRYPEVFPETSGLRDMFEKEINVTSDFKSKRLKSYAIPEVLFYE